MQRLDNPARVAAAPQLSVLVPFYRDDPTPLLAAFDREAAALAGRVELVLLDDAGGDAALSARAETAVRALALPARLLRLAANEGRAAGRNHLAAEARAERLLFVDADMLPDRPDFLARWLDLALAHDPPVAVGGFSLDQVEPGPEHRLHHAMQRRAECLPASERARQPEKYVFTSNLLVRRAVLAAEPFDDGFKGWGWEDVEWGSRVAARFGVVHIDNTLTHLGLDDAETLAGKYAQSAPNFARLLARHPETVRRYPSYRTARALSRLPARDALRAGLRRLALAEQAPLIARVMALKLYRAAVYAEVVR